MGFDSEKFLTVAAECASFHWSIVESFYFARGCLSLSEQGGWREHTERLERDCLDWLCERHPGVSADFLEQWRDQTWYGSDRSQVRPLLDLLGQVALQFVEVRDGRYYLRTAPDTQTGAIRSSSDVLIPVQSHLEQAEAWGILTTYAPADLFLAAHAASIDGRVPPPNWSCNLSLSTPRLEGLLIEGCADLHVHRGSNQFFALAWQKVMSHRTRSIFVSDPPGPQRAPFDLERDLKPLLNSAALARILIAFFLWGDYPSQGKEFKQYLRDGLPLWHSSMLLSPGFFQTVRGVIRALFRGRPSANQSSQESLVHVLKSIYDRIFWEKRRPDHIADEDPLSRILPTGHSGQRSPLEFRLLCDTFRYLKTAEGSRDIQFSTIVWQYLRIKHMFYRHYVALSRHTPGFASFSKLYGRGKFWMNLLESDPQTSKFVVSQELENPCLRTLEVRTSPKDDYDGQRTELIELLKWFREQHNTSRSSASDAAKEAAEPLPEKRRKLGLLLHFIKNKDGDREQVKDKPSHDLRIPHRYGHSFEKYVRQASHLLHLLVSVPALSHLVRGIDVANLELDVPSWVFAPIFNRFRHEWKRADKRAHESKLLHELGHPPYPAYTFHCGEDFRDLAQGLRRIYETSHFMSMERKDRLGHCVALGVDSGKWLQENPVVVLPREEYLDDLVWEYDLYRRRTLADTMGISPWLGGKITAIGREIGYNEDFSADDFLDAYEKRHNPKVLEALGFPYDSVSLSQSAPRWQRLLLDYLAGQKIWIRGRGLIRIAPEPHRRERLHTLQQWLLGELSRQELVIETCPTSNVLIGGLSSYENHPIFRIQPPPAPHTEVGERAVWVTINTDNPVTFSTDIQTEYSLIYLAATSTQKVSPVSAENWLESIRETGNRSSFVRTPNYPLPATVLEAIQNQVRLVPHW